MKKQSKKGRQKTGALLGGMLAGVTMLSSMSGPVLAATQSIDENPYMTQIVEGENHLGSQLMAKLTEAGENVFISPYSIGTALAMLSSCSEEGAQVEELRTFLGYDGMSEEQMLEAQERLAVMLDPGAVFTDMTAEEKEEFGVGKVELANAMYVKEGLPLLPAFDELPSILAAYQAEFAMKNLSTEETMEEINAWVNEKTHEMIPSILEKPLDPSTAAVLMNVVYFQAYWAAEFPEGLTDTQIFHGIHEETEIPMMHQEDSFAYAETEDYQMITLPYHYGYQMQIYVPKDISVCENWTDADYLDTLNIQNEDPVHKRILLSMPKFELEYGKDLVETFQELGVTGIFEDSLYDRITEKLLSVSMILHKTALKIDEKGTEASAVTMIAMDEGAAIIEIEDPIEVTIDRPFYFTITHRRTGLHLFEGCIFDLP